MSVFEFSDSPFFSEIDDFLEKSISLGKLNETVLRFVEDVPTLNQSYDSVYEIRLNDYHVP